MTPTPDWCEPCQERTALTDSGLCPFCDTPLVAKGRRGGWKRPDLAGSKFTDAQLRALHRAHMDGASINQLAKHVYDRVGYSSHHSAAQAISRAWKRMGLPARPRVEAVKKACTIHGMAPKHGPRPGYGTYKRRLHQPDQPQCAAVKRQPPGKGRRCSRPALHGSTFCAAHEPSRELARQAALKKMRARMPRPDMLPIEPFVAWLHMLRAEHGSLRTVAAITGLHYSALCRYAKGQATNGQPKPTISRRTVEQAATKARTTIAAIYHQEAIAA